MPWISAFSWASLIAHLVKNLPAMWETWVWSLGWEEPQEKGKATHSSILAWRVPWAVLSIGLQCSLLSLCFLTEKPGGPQSIGLKRVRHNCGDFASTHMQRTVTTLGRCFRNADPEITRHAGSVCCWGCLVANSCLTLLSLQPPWTIASQAPRSVRFPRPEYSGWLPFLSPEGLPDSAIEPTSSAWRADFLPLCHLGTPLTLGN